MSFCQFGGHDSYKTPRTASDLVTILYNTLPWNVCNECKKNHDGGDATMDILLHWATEVDSVNELPESLEDNPLKQALLVQHIDKFLNLSMRIKFGDRFPSYLIDISETEKRYFLQELKQENALANIFLPDIQEGAKRETIALKLWVGATTGAKSTRVTYNVPGGEGEYNLEQRKVGFQKADQLANKDEIVRMGVQVAPIVELVITSFL